MGDPLGSSCVSSQKQNLEGMVEAQSGQYRAMVELSPGCGRGPGRDSLPSFRLVKWFNTSTLNDSKSSSVHIDGLFLSTNHYVLNIITNFQELFKATLISSYNNFSCESNPRMGDPLGSSRVSSQKQNREGVVGAQSGQYRATIESSLGCGKGPGVDVTLKLQNI
ncbi:unnamed protein product [Malus baccata var. baccata]